MSKRSNKAKQQIEQLESLRLTTLDITADFDRDSLLRTIVGRAVELLEAKGGGIYEYNPSRAELTVINDYSRPRRIGQTLKVGEDVAGRLVQSNHSFLTVANYSEWEGRLSVNDEERQFEATLQVPLRMADKVIGVLYVEDDRGRHFTANDAHLLGLFADYAAIAFDKSRRMEALSQMRHAAEALASSADTRSMLDQIVRRACTALRADSAAIWIYDASRDRFISESWFANSISMESGNELWKNAPNFKGTAHAIMEMKWIVVDDISNVDAYPFLGGSTHDLLNQIGVKSFIGICLEAGRELLGILYVNYSHQHTFDEDEKYAARTFANHAALALKNAKLMEQVKKANEAAEAVARVTVLGDRQDVLNSIVVETQKALACDSIVIYEYDTSSRRLIHPPTMVGVRDVEKVAISDEVNRDSVVYWALEREAPYLVENVIDDPLFRSKRFTHEEKIKSCVAIPLRVMNEKVGVMFINYRTHHLFTHDEMSNMNLFANQSAIAIRNAQLFELRTRQLRDQAILSELSQKLLGKVTLPEILDCAVVVAADVMSAEFSSIMLLDRDGDLIVGAAHGWEPRAINSFKVESGRGGQTHFTIESGNPVKVHDYNLEQRFEISSSIKEYGIQSGLSVPLSSQGKPVGAMLIYRKRLSYFSADDAALLTLIGNQTAIAIQTAKHYEAILRRGAQLRALYDASRAIASAPLGLERKKVLELILEQAVECLIKGGGRKAALGAIRLFDEQTNELVLESVYPSNEYPNLVERIGERTGVEISSKSDRRIGLHTRTLLTRQPHIIRDVRSDQDYIEFNPSTRSELAVPLVQENMLIGVLAMESDQLAAFDEDDMTTLQALSELAVVAIQNAQRYEDLKKTKGLVGATTALAWMGMTSSYWRHAVAGRASAITYSLRLLMNALPREALTSSAEKEIARIERLAQEILEKPITPPLASEEGVGSIDINNAVRERVSQLWEKEQYHSIILEFNLVSHGEVTVRVNPHWLRQILDLLIENAVNAMTESENRKLTITIKCQDEWVNILLADTGKGISPEVLPHLFEAPIQKTKEAKGLGMGLLMAQTIAQVYGGEIGVASTGPAGTTMFIKLPAEK